MLKKTGAIPFLLAPTLGIFVFPFVALTLILNEIVRFVLSQILNIFYGKKLELVSDGADGFWGFKRKGSSRNVVTFVTTPAGSLDPDKIAKFYIDHIQNYRDKTGKRPYKKFEKIMTIRFGYSCWKTNYNFNVFNHIRVLPEKKLYTPEDLQQMLTQFAEDFDETKPQWEIILFPRYNDGSGEEKSVLLSRFLHCYMDGLSFMMLFKEHVTPDMEYTIDPLNFRIPFWKKAAFYISSFVYGPFYWTSLSLERLFLRPWILREGQGSSPRKKYYAWAKSRPVRDDDVRKIRTHSGVKASVTNVLSTAFVAAAIKTLPKSRLVEEILVSELVAYLPYPDPNPQNRFAYFVFPIPATEEDVWQKLRKCKKESMKAFTGPEILSTYYFFKIAGRFPAFLSKIWLYGSTSSVLLSNAPFSKVPVQFPDGTLVDGMGGFTPHPNDMGLSITTTRYGNDIKIFACSDSTWLSQEELTKLIDQIPIVIEEMVRDVEAGNNNVEKTMDSSSAVHKRNIIENVKYGNANQQEDETNRRTEKRVSISESEFAVNFNIRSRS